MLGGLAYKKIYRSVLACQELSSWGGKINLYTDTGQNQTGYAREWSPLELCSHGHCGQDGGAQRRRSQWSGPVWEGGWSLPTSLLVLSVAGSHWQSQRVRSLVIGLVKHLKKKGTSVTGKPPPHSCRFPWALHCIVPSWPAGPLANAYQRAYRGQLSIMLSEASLHFSKQLCYMRNQSNASFSSTSFDDWCFWTAVLEKTLESPLDCKEIKPVNPKGNQSWIFIGRTDAEAEALILWPPDAKSWLIWKDPDAGKDWRWEKVMTEVKMVGWHHWLDGHEFEQALGDGDGQGSLACCSPWGRKESDTTEWLNYNPWWCLSREEDSSNNCAKILPW